MKARGEWEQYGRPKAIDFNLFVKAYKDVEEGTVKPFECMRQLGMTKPSFYRYKKQYEALNQGVYIAHYRNRNIFNSIMQRIHIIMKDSCDFQQTFRRTSAPFQIVIA